MMFLCAVTYTVDEKGQHDRFRVSPSVRVASSPAATSKHTALGLCSLPARLLSNLIFGQIKNCAGARGTHDLVSNGEEDEAERV